MPTNINKFHLLTIFISGIILLNCSLVVRESCAGPHWDKYEYDDTVERAGVIHVDDEQHQIHNFHQPDDRDWVKFYAVADEVYTVKAVNLGEGCDVRIELYDTDEPSAEPLISRNRKFDGIGETETLEWDGCTQDGAYYLKLTHADPDIFIENCEYELFVFRPYAPEFPDDIRGKIIDASSKAPIEDVKVYTEEMNTHSLPNGIYKILNHKQGDYTLTAFADGYDEFTKSITIISDDDDELNDISDINLIPNCKKGDVNGDGEITLEDIKQARDFFYGVGKQPTTREFCRTSFCADEGISLCDLKELFRTIVTEP